jgi:hypothetical protein
MQLASSWSSSTLWLGFTAWPTATNNGSYRVQHWLLLRLLASADVEL